MAQIYQTVKVTPAAKQALQTATRRAQAALDANVTHSAVLRAALRVAAEHPEETLAALLDEAPTNPAA
jgi:hypothetical protein